MKNQTEPTLSERISSLIGVGIASVEKILRLMRAEKPSTIAACSAIIRDNFATPEEKEEARRTWAVLSEAEINKANNFKLASDALRHAPPIDEKLMKLAAAKIVAYATEAWKLKLEFISSKDFSTPDHTREAVNGIFRKQILQMPIGLSEATDLLKTFAGTEDQSAMEQKIVALVRSHIAGIERLSEDKRKFGLNHLYLNTPTAMRVTKSNVRLMWIRALDEKDLREAWKSAEESLKIKKEEQNRTFDSASKEDLKNEIEELELVMKQTAWELDKKTAIAIHDESSESALLGAFREPLEPRLPRSRSLIAEKLLALWEQELLQESISFEREAEIFSNMQKVLPNDKTTLVKFTWAYEKIAAHIDVSNPEHKDRAATIMGAARYSPFEEASLHLWLRFKPRLHELLAKFEDAGFNCRDMLLDAIIKESDNFEKALASLDSQKTGDERAKLIQNLASQVLNLTQGMLALQKMNILDRYEGRRIVLLRKVLQFVKYEEELKLLMPFIGTDKPHDLEERLLVEKAVKLLGKETMPPEA